jgi:hypothetical protein
MSVFHKALLYTRKYYLLAIDIACGNAEKHMRSTSTFFAQECTTAYSPSTPFSRTALYSANSNYSPVTAITLQPHSPPPVALFNNPHGNIRYSRFLLPTRLDARVNNNFPSSRMTDDHSHPRKVSSRGRTPDTKTEEQNINQERRLKT